MPASDVDDAAAMRLLESTCRVLGVSLEEAADAFGEYWCCTYAPRLYQVTVEKWRDARDAILSLDEVHVRVTQSMKNARPPRFDYRWLDENTLEVYVQVAGWNERRVRGKRLPAGRLATREKGATWAEP